MMQKFLFFLGCIAGLIACESVENPAEQPDETGKSAYAGTLTVTPLSGGESQQFEGNRFELTFSIDEASVTLDMIETRFVANMPQLDMSVPNIPCMASAGGYLLKADSVIPFCGGIPYEQYVITDIDGTLQKGRLDLAFKCMGFQVTYSGQSVSLK